MAILISIFLLKTNGCLVGTYCSSCKKIIMSKHKLSKEESMNKFIFNRKCLLFSYENFSTVKDASYAFCVVSTKDTSDRTDGKPQAK